MYTQQNISCTKDLKLAHGKNKSSELLTSLHCMSQNGQFSKVSKTYIGRKIELVFNLFDTIFFDSSFRIQGCKCEQLMRYLNFRHQFLRCPLPPNGLTYCNALVD